MLTWRDARREQKESSFGDLRTIRSRLATGVLRASGPVPVYITRLALSEAAASQVRLSSSVRNQLGDAS
jgi:hypothetical protein